MEIEIIERDLTDNKLFYRTNSALVEAQKVIIKVASLQKDKDEGRGGGVFERGACLILWPWGCALIRAWVLIRGNTVTPGTQCITEMVLNNGGTTCWVQMTDG